ncbi:hypothetical protein WJX74_004530 [Apatococcus lobatus]|uniref:Very-long-chain (3R)-3-hydroxyacyl-CoA dehydratase n=2 Tax=Apatococcus TaxID=904362 RepID=A0AAW1S5R7_9CHLO
MASLRSTYLYLYNSILCSGWCYILYQATVTWLSGWSPAATWEVVEIPLKIFQTAALLEVAHSLLGVVRAPLLTSVMQVASRLWLLWGIVDAAPAAALTRYERGLSIGTFSLPVGFHTMLMAWGLSEVIRYSFFSVKEWRTPYYWLTWLRFTGFLILYPVGVASEMAMVRLAYPAINDQRIFCFDMPNRVNFGLDYPFCCIVLTCLYLPGFPFLFSHMLRQRAKILGPSSQKQQ